MTLGEINDELGVARTNTKRVFEQAGRHNSVE